MRMVQLYVDKIFVQNYGRFWRPFDLMVHLQKYYLPLLCFQKSLIPTQWNMYTARLVGGLCTTHKKMKGYFLKKLQCTVSEGLISTVKRFHDSYWWKANAINVSCIISSQRNFGLVPNFRSNIKDWHNVFHKFLSCTHKLLVSDSILLSLSNTGILWLMKWLETVVKIMIFESCWM